MRKSNTKLGEREEFVSAAADDRLETELDWYVLMLGYFLQDPVSEQLVRCAILETLMSAGQVTLEQDGAEPVFRLRSEYRRSAVILVPLLSALEVVLKGLRDGLKEEECLDRAMNMENWRPVEVLPSSVLALVRRCQRDFPDRLVRKMPPALFGFLVLPKLVAEGLVEECT